MLRSKARASLNIQSWLPNQLTCHKPFSVTQSKFSEWLSISRKLPFRAHFLGFMFVLPNCPFSPPHWTQWEIKKQPSLLCEWWHTHWCVSCFWRLSLTTVTPAILSSLIGNPSCSTVLLHPHPVCLYLLKHSLTFCSVVVYPFLTSHFPTDVL